MNIHLNDIKSELLKIIYLAIFVMVIPFTCFLIYFDSSPSGLFQFYLHIGLDKYDIAMIKDFAIAQTIVYLNLTIVLIAILINLFILIFTISINQKLFVKFEVSKLSSNNICEKEKVNKKEIINKNLYLITQRILC